MSLEVTFHPVSWEQSCQQRECNRFTSSEIFCLDVRGSVHHNIIHKENPTRCNSVSKFLFNIYVKFNIFWATHGPSSGAYNCTSSLWCCIRGGLLAVCLLDAVSVQQLHVQQPSTYAKPEAVSCSFRLLMMNGMSPETCWASYK